MLLWLQVARPRVISALEAEWYGLMAYKRNYLTSKDSQRRAIVTNNAGRPGGLAHLCLCCENHTFPKQQHVAGCIHALSDNFGNLTRAKQLFAEAHQVKPTQTWDYEPC